MSTSSPPTDRLTERLYRGLLCLYPARHRNTYGPLMLQVFRDLERAAYREHGRWGALTLWANLLPDLGSSAAYEQIHDWRSNIMSLTCKTGANPRQSYVFIVAAIVSALAVAGKALLVYFGAPVVVATALLIIGNLVSAAIVARITGLSVPVMLSMGLWMVLALLPTLWVPDAMTWLRRNPFNLGIIILISAFALRQNSNRAVLYLVALILGLGQIGATLI